MLLEYTKINLHTVAFRTKAAIEKHKGSVTVLQPEEITLFPGTNRVDDTLWQEAKAANEGIRKLVKAKTIREYPGDPLQRDASEVAELILFNPDNRETPWKGCVDEKLLEEFKATDTREEVQNAIALQYKRLEAGIKRKNEDQVTSED